MNPNSDVDEEHHFILSRDLMVGEQDLSFAFDGNSWSVDDAMFVDGEFLVPLL